mmetsp:Transcript_11610/g.43610  ORF Transcript_11610/g.43610 Transcript_11610/m.43610 type:complete len:113 (+) Transcript_11610:567-905(+)
MPLRSHSCSSANRAEDSAHLQDVFRRMQKAAMPRDDSEVDALLEEDSKEVTQMSLWWVNACLMDAVGTASSIRLACDMMCPNKRALSFNSPNYQASPQKLLCTSRRDTSLQN